MESPTAPGRFKRKFAQGAHSPQPETDSVSENESPPPARIEHHPKEKPKENKCETCDLRFGREGDRRRHERIIHQPRGTHKCPHCGKTLSREDAVKRHIKRSQCAKERQVAELDQPGPDAEDEEDGPDDTSFILRPASPAASTSEVSVESEEETIYNRPPEFEACPRRKEADDAPGVNLLLGVKKRKVLKEERLEEETGDEPQDERKFGCRTCGLKFGRDHDRRRHEVSVHDRHGTNAGRHECTFCGKVMSRKDALHRHLSRTSCGAKRTAVEGTSDSLPAAVIEPAHRAPVLVGEPVILIVPGRRAIDSPKKDEDAIAD